MLMKAKKNSKPFQLFGYNKHNKQKVAIKWRIIFCHMTPSSIFFLFLMNNRLNIGPFLGPFGTSFHDHRPSKRLKRTVLTLVRGR
jgi:hypothetical protein